ncbi:MAG: hypothetical protein JSR66_32970 [Proteobacteria bacterium]|nr:hypothetical protein [Pseudomonadota bacterium]
MSLNLQGLPHLCVAVSGRPKCARAVPDEECEKLERDLHAEDAALERPIPVGREPDGVRISPNGQWVLVTNDTDNSITIVDGRSLQMVRSVQGGTRTRDVGFTRKIPWGGLPGMSPSLPFGPDAGCAAE